MTYTRGQERFVAEELVSRVRNGMLEDLGYNAAPGLLPWDLSSPLVWVEAPPDPLVSGAKVDSVEPNTIAFSEGPLPPDAELQLGGSLYESTYTFFIDVYGENRSLAKAIALDVRSLLTDKIDGHPSIFPLRNWAIAGKPEMAGHQLRIEDVEVAYPGATTPWKVHWAVVKLTVIHEHPSGY